MPITAFMKIPGVDGESTYAEHEDEIDVHDIAWGIERLSTASVGRGRARARTDMSPLSVAKFTDASSPYLALAVKQGKFFDEVVVSVRKDSGEAHLDYLIITMENVILSSYDIGTDENGQLIEEVEIDFEKATLKYTQQNSDGSAGGEHEVTITAT